MTIDEIPAYRISKSNIINLLTEKKDAEGIVALWDMAKSPSSDKKANLRGSWTLTDIEVEHIITLLREYLKIQKKIERNLKKHTEELGIKNQDSHDAKKREEKANNRKEKYKKNLLEVLEDVVMSGLPRTVIQQTIDRVTYDIHGIDPDERLNNMIPVEFRETSDITSVGSVVCAGERVILDKSHSIGVKGAFTELGELVISWDHSESADSCRAMGNEDTLTISLCDGSSEGDISSRIFSRLLTTIMTEMVPLSKKSMRLLIDKPMRNFLKNRLYPENEKSVRVIGGPLRDLSKRDAQEAVRGLGNAGATAVNVIVHRTGWCWSSGIGDSALYLIRNDHNSIEPLILSPNLKDDATNLIRIGKPAVTVNSGNMVELQKGDVLVGVTDLVAEFIEGNRSNLLDLVSLFKSVRNHREPSFWNDFFKEITNSLPDKNDDMTIFVYVHGTEKLSTEEEKYIHNSASRTYTLRDIEYEEFEKEYYFNHTNNKGAKRITDPRIASNLRIIQEKMNQEENNWVDFLPDFEIIKTGTDYFLLMEHFDESYIRLDKKIEISNLDELERVRDLLNKVELELRKSGISHGDFAPTNIMIHKETFDFKLIDLNTLYIQGCFPHDELGHKGMFGQESLPCIPSLHSHIFPLRSLKLSVELMISKISSGQATTGGECFNPTSDEDYVLSRDKLTEYFLSEGESTLDEHTNDLKSLYPNMSEDKIREQLSKLKITDIYNFDSW